MELITKAAIKYPDGQVATSDRHWKIIRRQATRGISSKNAEQGFVTSEGRFVDRTEAARIAFGSGQMQLLKRVLFSEDILEDTEGTD